MTAEIFVSNSGRGLSTPITNSTLRYDEFRSVDKKLVSVAESVLVGVGDLRDRGLITYTPDGIGTIVSSYNKISNITEADVSMYGESSSEKDRPTYELVNVPVPIFSKNFIINERELMSSRSGSGSALDLASIGLATRVVSESIESCLFNGLSRLKLGANPVYGYTSHPDRIQYTLSGTGWGDTSTRTILEDVTKMIQLAKAKNRSGSFYLYVADDIYSSLLLDYSDSKAGNQTFVQRLLQMDPIIAVKSAPMLASGNVLLVSMDDSTVDLAIGQDITVRELTSMHNMAERFVVMACMVPRVKSDINGSCGIVHATPA